MINIKEVRIKPNSGKALAGTESSHRKNEILSFVAMWKSTRCTVKCGRHLGTTRAGSQSHMEMEGVHEKMITEE